MSSRTRFFVLAVGAAALGGGVVMMGACSDSAETITPDASTEAGDTGSPDTRLVGDVVQLVDAACPEGKLVGQTGETCIGFGTGSPCDPACGIPAYGYTCFKGGPPTFTGCLQLTKSSLGETYCCPELRCVAQPDQDPKCTNAARPHRYQCPPDGDGGTTAAQPGCEDAGAGPSALEHFFCCP